VVREQASQRWPAATGLIAAALLLAALVAAPEPVWPEEQAGGLTATFYATYEPRLRLQALLLALAMLVFLWFVGTLRAFLARVERGGAPLASVAAAAGVVTAVLGLLDAAVLTALLDLRGAELTAKAQGSAWAARSLFYVEGALSSALFLPVLVLVVATSLAVLRTGVLPRWLGLAGVVLGALVLLVLVLEALDAFELGGRITGLLVLLWVGALSTMMVLRREAEAEADLDAASTGEGRVIDRDEQG
jgi:hypothetical protein